MTDKHEQLQDLYSLLTQSEFIKTIDSHYKLEGLKAVVRDTSDGKDYRLTLRPLTVEESQAGGDEKHQNKPTP